MSGVNAGPWPGTTVTGPRSRTPDEPRVVGGVVADDDVRDVLGPDAGGGERVEDELPVSAHAGVDDDDAVAVPHQHDRRGDALGVGVPVVQHLQPGRHAGQVMRRARPGPPDRPPPAVAAAPRPRSGR